jgi:hypothetical protein
MEERDMRLLRMGQHSSPSDNRATGPVRRFAGGSRPNAIAGLDSHDILGPDHAAGDVELSLHQAYWREAESRLLTEAGL